MAKEYLEKLSAFIDSLPSAWSEDIQLECRHFFSGAALYVNGRICLTLTPVGLALKLPPERKEQLLAAKKAVPLRYFPNAPIKKEYALIPGGLESEDPALSKYIRESIAYQADKKA